MTTVGDVKDYWSRDRESCGWGCDHEEFRATYHRTQTGELFECEDLTKLVEFVNEHFVDEALDLNKVRGAVLDALKQSAKDHHVGAEAVSPLHVIVYDQPNDYGDIVWVATQYRWAREKVWATIGDWDDFEWKSCEPRTSQATYGWSTAKGASCYAD